MSTIPALARQLSAAQRHCILRFSDAEEWDHSGCGMARSWPDIVYGRKGAQFRSIRRLVNLGLAAPAGGGSFRLTPLGLSVQLEVRQGERRQ
jgi:hypothetical protein